MGHSHKTLKNDLMYSNWTLVAPDGEPLCRCAEKRALWYIRRNLAERVDTPAGPAARLLFEPKGRGEAGDDYSLAPKANLCCACGSPSSLTKHHVVPAMYRRHFPKKAKARQSHDVVPLCVACHHRYENKAEQFKLRIAEAFGVDPRPKTLADPLLKARRLAAALLRDADRRIPEIRRTEILALIAEAIGRAPSEADLAELSVFPPSEPEYRVGELVVREVLEAGGLEEFVRSWRKHFVDSESPRFLPTGWSLDRPAESR